MTRAEFAAAMKAKYPVYQSIPDDELVDSIVAKYPQYGKQIEETPKLGVVGKEEPGTYMGGLIKGLKENFSLKPDAATTSLMEAAAHPQSLGDFATLLLPSFGMGTGLRSLRGYAEGAKNLVTGAAEGAANKQGLSKLPAILRGMKDVALDTESGGTRKFQATPLAQQMEMGALPTTETPLRTRAGGPVASGTEVPTPFHELPLSQQMESLPQAGRSGSQRSGGPPMSQFNPNDAPLASIMDRIPAGRGPLDSRIGTPPHAPQTPFHELPLYQQMQELSGLPPSVGSLRTGGPPLPTSTPNGFDRYMPNVGAPASERRIEELLKEFGGRGGGSPVAGTSPQGVGAASATEFPPAGGQGDWHSGLPSGTAEAKGASALHRETGMLDALYRSKLRDPLAALLLSLSATQLAPQDKQP